MTSTLHTPRGAECTLSQRVEFPPGAVGITRENQGVTWRESGGVVHKVDGENPPEYQSPANRENLTSVITLRYT
ncbi:hypothetical protein J6590_066753 [Homalodisca vitripennis]|nr:hypothetical protein J6590_066753 [Homalodisca vitripennis]